MTIYLISNPNYKQEQAEQQVLLAQAEHLEQAEELELVEQAVLLVVVVHPVKLVINSQQHHLIAEQL
jgi:hypothetical protein